MYMVEGEGEDRRGRMGRVGGDQVYNVTLPPYGRKVHPFRCPPLPELIRNLAVTVRCIMERSGT